jgi:predicted HTH transcriptional regulator
LINCIPSAPVEEAVQEPAKPVATLIAEPETVSAVADEPSIAEILREGESSTVEFKSSLRINLHTKNPDTKIEHAVLKTIAAFLNSDGGTLVVGADDRGTPLGLDADGFQSQDKMQQHLANLIRDRLGVHHNLYIDSRVAEYEGKRLLVVAAKPGKSPAYVKDGKAEYFYIRSGTTTAELPASKIHDYVQHRFG